MGGQAGGKGLHQGGKRIREPEMPTLYQQEVSGLLKAPQQLKLFKQLWWLLRALIVFIYKKIYIYLYQSVQHIDRFNSKKLV